MEDITINITLSDSFGFQKNFTSLKDLYDFSKLESKFWNNALNQYEGKNKNIYPFLSIGSFNEIINYINSNNNIDKKISSDDLKSLINRSYGIYHILINEWVYSNHPFTRKLLQCLNLFGRDGVKGFCDFIRNKENNSTQNSFSGQILAYEFINQDSDLVKRRKSERESLERLRQSFIESRDSLFSETEDIKNTFRSITDQANKDREDQILGLEEDRNIQSEEHREAMVERHAQIDSFLKESQEKINTLENTYQEKLRLVPAAQYWKDAAKNLSHHGCWYVGILTFLALIGASCGVWIFKSWLSNEAIPLSFDSLQGFLITATVLALYAFILRIFSRLAFSSFHLMRDAEEREQLTYLYLALSNETQVDERSREIILQALFSRSETGLLTNENGPTMPGLDIGHLLNRAK